MRGPSASQLCLMVLAAALVGCAAGPYNLPRNQPLPARPPDARQQPHEPTDVLDDVSVAVSFSGGGIRAAAFSLGILQGLDRQALDERSSLLDRLSFITSVSGGSLTSAYYGLHGKEGLLKFQQLLKDGDGEATLRLSLVNPLNLWRLWSGGLNAREDLKEWLEGQVFGDATFGDMYKRGKPLIWINATNLEQRIAFPFQERTLEAMCSDIASYPLSEAVAASMAVPLVFSPVVLENFPERCAEALPAWVDQHAASSDPSLLSKALLSAVKSARDRGAGRYLKLVDGGISDNLGLTSLHQMRILLGTPYGPWTERDALRVRRLLFIVVDSGRRPNVRWNQSIAGPNAVDVASASIDAAIDTNARLSYDSFLAEIKAWEAAIVRYRCTLPPERVGALAQEMPGWRCDDVRFEVTRISFDDLEPSKASHLSAIPTRLRLDPADVDALVESGAEAIERSSTFQAFLRDARAGQAR